MSFEKRNCIRHQVHIPCRIISDGIQVHGKLVDISQQGIGISGSLPFLTTGKTVLLEVDTGNIGDNQYLRIELEVRSLKKYGQSIHQFGGILKNLEDAFHDWFEQVMHALRPKKSSLLEFASVHL